MNGIQSIMKTLLLSLSILLSLTSATRADENWHEAYKDNSYAQAGESIAANAYSLLALTEETRVLINKDGRKFHAAALKSTKAMAATLADPTTTDIETSIKMDMWRTAVYEHHRITVRLANYQLLEASPEAPQLELLTKSPPLSHFREQFKNP